MRPRLFLSSAAVTCFITLAATSCREPTEQAPPPVGPITLEPTPPAESANMPADNSLCIVCHLNFAENDAIAGHVSERITCAHCHGVSIDHMNDESMMTSPDILYGRTEVGTMCQQCHSTPHRRPDRVEAFLKKWTGRGRKNGRTITEDSICADCHGLHTVPKK